MNSITTTQVPAAPAAKATELQRLFQRLAQSAAPLSKAA